jgi:hypothetical protein
MKAVLIDPHTKTVTDIDLPEGGRLEEMRELIGCDLLTAITLESGDSLFLDDEGLYVPGQKFFALPEDYIEPLAGRALVLGLDHSNGESIDAHFSSEDILDSGIVFFEDIEEVLDFVQKAYGVSRQA